MGWQDWRNRLPARRTTTARTTPTNTNANRGPQRQSAADLEYYNPQGQAAQYRDAWLANVPQAQRTQQGYQSFMSGGAPPGSPVAPVSPGGPGGGGRGGGGRGGGGGGGGGPAMTQAMFDAMLQALGTRGPRLDLPDFQGTNIAAFNPQMYNDLNANLGTAFSRDTAAINQGAQQTTQALGQYSANPYAGAQAAPAAPVAPQGAALQATAGAAPGAPNANAAAAQQVNAGGGAETAAFNDLLKVLGANYNQAQNSRLGEVQMTAQSARNQLGAQRTGLGAQIGMARNQAQQQWQQQDNERRYNNNLMAQQWQREETQGNWQQGNEMIQNRLAPLLQLLQGTAGANINTSALQQMLQGWSS